MEATNCVKAVVVAANQYNCNPSDNNVEKLQRQIDVLISVSGQGESVNFFHPHELLSTQCLSGLVDIMNDPQTKPTLAHKAMLLLDNLSASPEVRENLHRKFHLTPCLARFLRVQAASHADPNTVLCVKLLHKITYGCRVTFQENYVEDLVKFLIKQIQSKENELTMPSLGLLANLCRHSFSVQMIVKRQEQVKALYKKLGSFLSHANQRMIVFSLSSISSLCLNDDFGEKVFSTRNINDIFHMLFNILVNSDSGRTRRYAVDLFTDLLKQAKIQHALTIYDPLSRCIKEVLALLCNRDIQEAPKIFELLLALCSVNSLRCAVCQSLLDSPGLQNTASYKQLLSQPQITQPFFAVLHWAGQSVTSHDDAPLYALDFLRELYEELLDSGLSASLTPRTDLVLPMVTEALKQTAVSDGAIFKKHCLKVVKGLQLLTTLCNDEALRSQVAEAVDLDMCVRLVEHQLDHNSLALNHTITSVPSSKTPSNDWCETGSDVVLHTMDLMMQLRRLVTGMEARFHKLLQDSRAVPFLAYGVSSGNRARVQIALRLLSRGIQLKEFPLVVMGDMVAAQNSHHQQQQQQQQQHFSDASKQPAGEPMMVSSSSSYYAQDKENVQPWESMPQSTAPSYPGNKTTPLSTDMETSLQNLIDKMQSGMALKDARASEILSVYEHKLQGLQTKENHLEDLLEAKTLALAQADRLITQYRCRMARSEAEAQKLRCMLQEWERRTEEYREQVNDMMLEQERAQNDLEQMAQDNAQLEAVAAEHRELTEAYAEQTQRLENSQRSLTTLKQEHLALKEMQEMLRRHNESLKQENDVLEHAQHNLVSLKQEHLTLKEMHELLQRHHETLKQQHDIATSQLEELEEERKTQSRQLKDKESRIQDLSHDLRATEADLKKAVKDRDEQDLAIDKLRDTLGKTEQTNSELRHEVSSLELVCRQREVSLKDMETQLSDMKVDLEKHKRISELIHSLSSGKNGEPCPS